MKSSFCVNESGKKLELKDFSSMPLFKNIKHTFVMKYELFLAYKIYISRLTRISCLSLSSL